jgi:tetratricopeptide (TPR) repeat protein
VPIICFFTFTPPPLYSQAVIKYNKVFAYTTGLMAKDSQMAQYQKTVGQSPPSQTEEAQINSLEIASWSNLSICFIKLNHPSKALDTLAKILQRDPENGKALFNAGRAYLMMNKLDEVINALMNTIH